MLELNVTNREVKILGEEEFVRGTVGANCKIALDEFWSGYANTVVFKRDGRKPINIIIDSLDNTIEIPHEILAESGEFKIGVFGLKPDEVLPTLWSENIKIRYGTDTHGTTPTDYTPSEVEQLKVLKQDKLTAGDGIVIEGNVISASGGGTDSGTTDYEELDNKPKINGVELSGNKTTRDLNIKLPDTWRTIQHLTLTEDTNSIIFSADSEGKPFNLKKARLIIKGGATHARLNTYINKSEYVSVYFYSSLAVNSVSNHIYEIGEVTNALRVITLTRTSNSELYLLADSDASFKPVITKNKNGENTPISHLKMELIGGHYFLSGTEFIFEGVDEE